MLQGQFFLDLLQQFHLSTGGGMKKALFVSGRETGMALKSIFLVLQGCSLAV